MDLVSVILPAYNAESFIFDAIDSVLTQTYKNLELIIIDDGSTDNTASIISNYKGIRYLHQQNSGAATARNHGISVAKGKFIAFIDADDLWLPEKIEEQVNFLNQFEYQWCYCDSYFSWFDSGKSIGRLSSAQGKYHNDVLIPYISGKFSIPLPSTLIRANVLEEIGCFDESLRTEEHTDLWARIAIKYPIGFIDQPLVEIRKRFDSLKGSTDPIVTGKNRRQVLEKLISIAPDRLLALQNKLITTSYVMEGKHLLRVGRISEARKRFGKAMKTSPFNFKPYLFWAACWVEPIPKTFYKLRWNLLRNSKANIQPGWWIEQE